jgi:hypothetical protein
MSLAGESKTTFENAVLKEQKGDKLTFLVNREERISALSGRLVYRTSIVNESHLPIGSEQMTLGSVWNLNLQYPVYEEGLPVILEMEKVKGAEPK